MEFTPSSMASSRCDLRMRNVVVSSGFTMAICSLLELHVLERVVEHGAIFGDGVANNRGLQLASRRRQSTPETGRGPRVVRAGSTRGKQIDFGRNAKRERSNHIPC